MPTHSLPSVLCAPKLCPYRHPTVARAPLTLTQFWIQRYLGKHAIDVYKGVYKYTNETTENSDNTSRAKTH